MKNPNRETVSELEALPNLGKAISSDLRLVGISKPQSLIGKNPFDLYDELCIKKSMHHVIFDIDGTLTQSNEFDSRCYIEAVKEGMGISIDDNWSNYKHVTDSGILNEIIVSHGLTKQREEISKRVKELFVNKIHNYLQKNPISEVQGASSFLSQLKNNNQVVVSIATGGWYESAVLKLQYANIDFEGIPIVSSNDHFSRTEIMKLAEKRIANPHIYRTSYFGDATWDKEACKALGYNFIAVGNNVEHYQKIEDYTSIDKAMGYLIQLPII